MSDLRVIGYCRVSTEEQGRSGLGIEAQQAALRAEAERRGWRLELVIENATSAKTMAGRPVLAAALDRLRRGQADALAVSKLDRLSRSVRDFATVLDDARRERWALVLLDLGVDTSTVSGELTANVMASFAQAERRRIGERTRDALAIRKAQGVRLGRPAALPADVVARIVTEHAAGGTLSAIARNLTADSVPTAQGGARWYPATVRKVLAGQQAAGMSA